MVTQVTSGMKWLTNLPKRQRDTLITMAIAMPVVTVAIMGTIVEVLISAVVTVITTTSNCMVNLDVPMDLQSYEIAYLIIK